MWDKQLKRGGSWGRNPRNCRSATRNNNNPENRNNNNGFRVVVPPQHSSQPELMDGNSLGVLRGVQPCSGDAVASEKKQEVRAW